MGDAMTSHAAVEQAEKETKAAVDGGAGAAHVDKSQEHKVSTDLLAYGSERKKEETEERRGVRDKPVIVVMGSTGVGKSKLAVELAKSLLGGKGEIVNMDSMQVYEGMDVATNKPTEEEMQGVAHHLFGVVQSTDTSFNVQKFVSMALVVIDEIHARGGLPVLVGGTNYYIYSLLWEHSTMVSDVGTGALGPSLVSSDSLSHRRGGEEMEGDAVDETGVTSVMETLRDVSKASEEDSLADVIEMTLRRAQSAPSVRLRLWEKLTEADAVAARKLHANDYRKVVRRLEFLAQTGRKFSDVATSQSPLARFSRTCLLWLDGQIDALTPRINRRVDEMIRRGLLRELVDVCVTFLGEGGRSQETGREACERLDFTSGILQSIGGKEFLEYLAIALAPADGQTGCRRGYEEGDEALDAVTHGADKLKRRTRRYAVVQRKWVLNKILALSPIVSLPVSDQWETVTLAAARNCCEIFLGARQGSVTNMPGYLTWDSAPASVASLPSSDLASWEKRSCETCQRTCNGLLEWQAHIKSKKHRMTARKRRRDAADKEKQARRPNPAVANSME